MEKKSNIGLKVGLIISILCVFGLLGYIAYNKIQEKENRNAPIIDIEKRTALKKTDIEDLLKRIEEINTALYEEYPINDVNKLSTRAVLSIGFNNIYGAYYVPSTYIENHIKYIIGDNVNIKHKDYLCSYDNIAFWKYEGDHYIFNQEHPGHGGGYGYTVSTFFKDASMDDDTIIINTNLLYEPASDTRGPITSYKDLPNSDKMVIENIAREDLQSEYEKIKDSLPTTTFTFRRSKIAGYNLESIAIK